MPLRVDLVYQQSTALDWTEVVTCAGCGQKWKAGVVAAGTGTGRATYGIGKDSARSAAGIDAFHAAKDKAQTLIARARCPKCGRRASSAGPVLGAVFLAFFLSMLLGGVIGAAGMAVSEKLVMAVCPVWLVGWVLLSVVLARRRFAEADACVRFQPIDY